MNHNQDIAERKILPSLENPTKMRATLDQTIELRGYNIKSVKSNESKIIINPASSGGLNFIVNYSKLIIPYDIHHLYAYQGRGGDRYNILSSEEDETLEGRLPKRGFKIHIVEHLISAFHGAGITDANIFIPANNGNDSAIVPSNGPGMNFFYESFIEHKKELGKYANEIIVRAPAKYTSLDKKGNLTNIEVQAADRLQIEIISSKHPDLEDINEQSFKIDDVYSSVKEHAAAKPIGRINNLPLFLLWKFACLIGYKGISKDNYIIATPFDTPDMVVEKMQPQYKETRNEYLAHTAFCDFLGEIYALGSSSVKAKFILENTNHITRVAALKQFVKNGTFAYNLQKKS